MKIILILVCINWNQMMLSGPANNASPPPNPSPSPSPNPSPNPKPTACFCDSCDPCTCRDGKHKIGCSLDGTPRTKEVDKNPSVVNVPVYRLMGGSGTVWTHQDYQYLVSWISVNDPVYQNNQQQCQSGNCPR